MKNMKLWLDDVRPAPDGWKWAKSVEEARLWIIWWTEVENWHFEACSLDHDLGQGGDLDGIKLLDWMAEFGFWPTSKPIVHSMNPVGRRRMTMTINRYWPGPPDARPGPEMTGTT